MSLIAICGFQGAGKDTLANILIKKFGYTKISFAGSVKDSVSAIFGWDRQLLEGVTNESREWREKVDEWWAKRLQIPHLTPRWVLQEIGTEVFRNHFHPDIWVASVEKKLEKLTGVVITDARFTNEIDTIKKLGGIIIHIKRNVPDWYESFSPPSHIHSSEYSWIKNKHDYTIENTGSINELEDKIIKILNQI
jgi:hypothetical protein